jgi:[1-hydroxy-2-(trimethylamino)ethyl]phosphonate dioxygenase
MRFFGKDYMKTIDRIYALYQSQGDKMYGENITQMQHAIQVAKLAENNNASDALIAAGLLHDIGHLLFNEQVVEWSINDKHEIIGATLLQGIFGEAVAEPVKLHVMAKRYLCGINEGYYEGLSVASRESLHLQGGSIGDSHKRSVFERNPYFDQAINLRNWDDEGKNTQDMDTDFSRYLGLLSSLELAA